ncbi:hypothetical protein P7C70_g7178, partial [Phenoliferia sp. Uapishka_3]
MTSLQRFITAIHSVLSEANIVVQAMPNVADETLREICRRLAIAREELERPPPEERLPGEDDTIEEALQRIYEMGEELVQAIEALPDLSADFFDLPVVRTGRRGRPRLDIPMEAVISCRRTGSTWKRLRQSALPCSQSTLQRRRRDYEASTGTHIVPKEPFTVISDANLDVLITQLVHRFPFCGQKMIAAMLMTEHRVRVRRETLRESLRRVDGFGFATRAMSFIKRRVYTVRGPNALWHMDANMKLEFWGFVIHGCIDGFSRLITYLSVTNNKRSATITKLFQGAVALIGAPSRVRADEGMENRGVELLMGELRGLGRFLKGRSIHNVRIERLWRDVRKDVTEEYRRIFALLEEWGLLHPDDRLHRAILFLVFQPRIQNDLDTMAEAWNTHKVRTEESQTPEGMWELGRLVGQRQGWWEDPGDVEKVDEGYGVDGEEAAELTAEQLAELEAQDAELEEETEELGHGGKDDDLVSALELLEGMDLARNDGQHGMVVYIRAAQLAEGKLQDLDPM